MIFRHGWPLSADACEDQMVFLGLHGYRFIAHDRRGHGRSSQPWNGNEMTLIEGPHQIPPPIRLERVP